MEKRTIAEIKNHVELLIEFHQHLDDKIDLNQTVDLSGLTNLAQLKMEHRAVVAELMELMDYLNGKDVTADDESMRKILSK